MTFLTDFFWGWTQYGFMRTAFWAVLLIGPLYGLLGTMAVDGRMAFFSDSLGHSAMTGIALGVMLGLETPAWAMIGYGIAYALLLTYVKARGAASTDTTIGVFSATGLALGVVLLSRNGGFAKYSGYLIGDLLAIEPGDIAVAAVLLAVIVVFWALFYNGMLLASISAPVAASRGVRVRALETAFSCLLAVVVMLSIRWVGTLMLNAMLVLPAASARNLARSVRQYHLISIVLSLVCLVVGFLLSFAWGTASGATIVLTLAVGYALSLFLRSHGVRREGEG